MLMILMMLDADDADDAEDAAGDNVGDAGCGVCCNDLLAVGTVSDADDA